MKKHWKSLNKNEKNIIIIVLVVVVALLFWLVRGYNTKTNVEMAIEQPDIKKVEKQERKYSRISFFHTKPPICSLAIPEDWEGKYRIDNSDKVARFKYIGGGESVDIFSIRKSESVVQKKVKDSKKIGDYWIYLDLSTESNVFSVNNEEYEAMKGDYEQIFKSLKCFGI